MSRKDVDRRGFLKGSLAASAGVAWTSSREEDVLQRHLARQTDAADAARPGPAEGKMPTGKIGNLTVSRLICGGNLIGGWAHARDLLYVSALFKAYNTDEKIMDTLRLCEEHGVNTIITNPVSGDVINRYWRERGGAIQWIVEGHPREGNLESGIEKSLEAGAGAAYIQGVIGDRLTKEGRIDLIAKTVEFIKRNKVPAGVGAHSLDVIVACEEAGVNPDFYVKTLHTNEYWSGKRPDQELDVISNPADNYWSITPEKTIEFMKTVEKPWIAFKVLAAGAIHPRKGLAYAFGNGADFCCVGMFDFQVREDVTISREVLSNILDRDRPWRA